MKIIRLQIKYFIQKHIFINELHYIRERERDLRVPAAEAEKR